MDGYLAKPLKREELIREINHRLAATAVVGHIPKAVVTDTAPANRPPIPIGEVLEEFDNDRDFLVEVIEAFVQSIHAQVVILKQAAAQSDTGAIVDEAHAIKGRSRQSASRRHLPGGHRIEPPGQGRDLRPDSRDCRSAPKRG